MKNRSLKILSWILQIVAAVILAQTLFFKFSAAPESVQLFTELGMEPQGRILIGALELVAVLLLLLPASAQWGALLSIGLMSGAIIGHFTHLGWDGERAVLGLLAVIVWLASLGILILRRMSFPFIRMVFDENREAAEAIDEENQNPPGAS